jgi:beta-mannosidase
VLLSIEENGERIDVHVTSDVNAAWQGSLRWKLVSLHGDVLEEGENGVSLDPLASSLVFSKTFQLARNDQRRVVFLAELWQASQLVSRSLATFVPNKHLELADPLLSVDVSQRGSDLEFLVSAKTLARFVQLSLTGADVVFSDNYFDVPAGETVSVTCTLPEGWTLEQARQSVQASSLYHSF